MTELPESSASVDLARTPDFKLGALLISPSSCRVRTGERDQRVEPRVMQVLVVLVRAAGRTVSRDELIEACWGGRFVSDDAVARAISLVRGLARGLEPPPFVIETVPKVGFQLEAADAPFDADQPHGASPLPIAESPSIPQPSRQRLLLIAFVALGLTIVAAGAAWLLVAANRPAGQTGRVEVMMFEPLQPDPSLQRYATALGDAVVRMLAGSGVETVQRPLRRDAGGPGGADLRVAGTVDRDGSKYVVNAQVISRRTGVVLWSARFDREAAAPVGFQEEAANRIGDALRCALWHRAADRKAVNERVFSLLLDVCEVWRGDPEPLLGPTEQLVRAAPDHSYAHSMRAIALALNASRFTHPVETPALADSAASEARRALQLDANNAEAYQALAIRYFGWGHWLEREQNFLRGGELSPTPPSFYNLYVETLREVGRWEDASEINRRTISADSFSPYQPSSLARMRAAAGDLHEAEALTERAELLNPDVGRQLRASIALWWQDPVEALTALPRYSDVLSPQDRRCYQAYLGRLVGAAGAPIRGLPPTCTGQEVGVRVRLLARQGDVDGAYAAFAADPNARYDTTTLFYPEMNGFRRDPRFMPLAVRLGLADYWLKSGHWPDFCREPGLPYDCRAEASRTARADR